MAKKAIKVWEHNFAEDSSIRDRILDFFTIRLKQIRDNRIQMESDWLEFFYMWNVEHDANHVYNGRARLYVPEVRKNVESQARQLTDLAFPNDDFFDCMPSPSGTKDGSDMQKKIRQFQIEQSKLRIKYQVFTRQACLYGTSPVYIPWKKVDRNMFVMGKSGKGVGPKKQKIELYNGPDFIPRNLMTWYALNPLKEDFQEDGCVEYLIKNDLDLMHKKNNGHLWGYNILREKALDATRRPEMQRYIEMVENTGLLVNRQGYAGSASINNEEANKDPNYLCATIFTDFVVPEACEDGEDPEMPIPVQIEIYNDDHVGLVRRNPFYHQQAPYLVGKYILPHPGNFYGQGIPQAIRYMQHELNSKAEQCMDSATLALNPIAFIDPGLAGQMSDFEIEPGAKWYVSPQGVKLASMPDVTATGYNAISQLRGQIADFSDRTPNMPTQLMGKARSATQAQTVSDSMSVDLKAFQLQNELLVLEPMMEMWQSLTDQNITEDQVLMILGESGMDWKRIIVPRIKLLGKYKYKWKVASQVASKPILARQMLDMFKVAAQLPPDAQQKLALRYDIGFKYLWKNVMGLPNPDQLFGLDESASQDPQVEYKLLKMGMEIQVLPNDDDQFHIKLHDKQLGETNNEEDKVYLAAHIAEHNEQVQAKAKQQQQIQQQQQMMLAIAAERGGAGRGQPLPGQPQQPQQAGNRTQLSPNNNPSDMASGMRP